MKKSLVSPFRQPKPVFAVAFACVVSFMGIGLVDPILPALSEKLQATPSQVELLFTSYLVITAVAMLITGWVSSRIGAKRTLAAGLVLIVAFSALAGAAHSIDGIVGFRAGWGLGNALFIATSLAVIVASASGGFVGAIILYETALGIGIALGPLLGGELGAISWRAPFFGVTVLMAIALVATLLLVEDVPRPAHRVSVTDPIRALRHRGLLTIGLTALLYNWGFFTVLGYAPFPLHLDTHQLGYVFTAWGVLVGVFAIFGAPWIQARLGISRALYVEPGPVRDRRAGHRSLREFTHDGDRGRHRVGCVHRDQQHDHDPGGHDRRAGATTDRVGVVRVHPLHRRRPRALRRRQDRRRVRRPPALLRRRRRDCRVDRRARDRPPVACRRRGDAGARCRARAARRRGGPGRRMTTETTERPYRIGEVAERVGITTRTIRYYEELGLLGVSSERAKGKHRVYTEADVARLQELIRLRDLLGLTLEELVALTEAEETRAELRSEYAETTSDRERVRIVEAAIPIVQQQLELVHKRQAAIADFAAELEGKLALLQQRRAELGKP